MMTLILFLMYCCIYAIHRLKTGKRCIGAFEQLQSDLPHLRVPDYAPDGAECSSHVCAPAIRIGALYDTVMLWCLIDPDLPPGACVS